MPPGTLVKGFKSSFSSVQDNNRLIFTAWLLTCVHSLSAVLAFSFTALWVGEQWKAFDISNELSVQSKAQVEKV